MKAPQVIEFKARAVVPDSFEIVDRDELEGFRKQSLTGRTWTMKDLRAWLGNKSPQWIRDNILENPRFSREIELMVTRREIKRPGKQWLFKAKPMAEFLEHHYSEFDW